MEKFRKEQTLDEFYDDLHKALFDEEEQDVGNDHPCHQYYGHDQSEIYYRHREAIEDDMGNVNHQELKRTTGKFKKNYW